MAARHCHACGCPLQAGIRKCISCNAPARVSARSATLLVALLITLVAALVVAARQEPAQPLQPPASSGPNLERLRFANSVAVAESIKEQLRDPDSVQWERILANDDASTICVRYRARNGFGGVNRERLVVHKNAVSQDSRGWDMHCTDHRLHDMTFAGGAA